MKLKRISSLIMALAVSLSALSMPCTTAEVKDDDFWQKASNNYAYQDYVAKNDTFSVDVYNKIDEAMQQLWNYNGNITLQTNKGKFYYETGIEYPSSAKTEDEFYAEWDEFQSAVLDLYFMYRNDHPQAYFSPSVLVSGGATFDSSGNFNGYFNVDIIVDKEFTSAEVRNNYKKMIYSYIDGANEAASIDSVYDRTKYLHDYLCKDMDYAFDADGNPAHDYYTNNIIGAVDKSINSGVCECYTKTLELLLDYYGVENAFATGWGLGSGAGSGGPHAWNMVKFEDGQYYGVDATYDDGNREFSGEIFYDYFAKGADESDFDDTHIPDYDYSTKYLYQLPAYAKTNFSPVKLSKASLSLTDGVKINFFADLNGAAVSDDDYVQFTSEGGVNQKVKLADAEKVGDIYKFSVNIRPDQMTEKVKAQYIYSATGLGNTPVAYSAADYAKSEYVPSSDHELVDSMMDYGAYAQLYTGKNIGTLDVTKYPNISVPADADFSGYSPINDDKSESVNVRSAALMIGSNTAIRVKFDISKFDTSNGMSFTCNGETLDYDVLDSNTVAVYVKGILPQQLDDFFEINAVFGSETIDFAYSPFSYMKYSFEKSDTDQNVKNLLTAMYNYNVAATEYLAK